MTTPPETEPAGSAATPSGAFLPIGIVIPNYNHAGFVGAAIESALAQDYQDVRVAVVDDGSTDGSREVIAAYGSRIQALFQANTGHTRACLNGWRALGTPVVMFLDADDILAPGAATAVVRTWRSGVSKVQFQLKVIDETGASTGVVFPKFPSGYDEMNHRAEMLRTCWHLSSPTSGNAYAASLLDELTTFDDLPRYIDSALNLMAPFSGDVVTLHKPLGSYRAHGSNVWLMRDFSLDGIERRMSLERNQQRLLQQICRRHAVAFDAKSALQNMLTHQENRLALAKFGRERQAAEPLLGVLMDNLRAQAGCSFRLPQRLMLMIWAVLVAILPKRAAMEVLMQRMSPSNRLPVIERLISLLSQRGNRPRPGPDPVLSNNPKLPVSH
jgi:hypothetical protein